MYLLKEILCILVLINLSTFNVEAHESRQTSTEKLRHDLFLHYDKFIRPAQHYNTTLVNISITVRDVNIEEQRNILIIDCFLSMSWKDEKLQWNSSEYDELKSLQVAAKEIWQPDIMVYNSAAANTIYNYQRMNCVLSEDGTIACIPLVQFVVYCNFNLQYWPFDTQKCFVKLGSWTYNVYEIDLQSGDHESDIYMMTNTEWKIQNISTTRHSTIYPCCPEPYVDITVNLTMQRRGPSYKAIIITPIFAIIIMILLNFWLPAQTNGKIILNGCAVIITSLFLLYFYQKCAIMSNHIPLIVLFYSSSLYVICFCMLGSVCVIWLARCEHNKPVPVFLKQTLTGQIGKLLLLSNYINQNYSLTNGPHTRDSISQPRGSVEIDRENQDVNHQQDDADEHHIGLKVSNKTDLQVEWVLVAAALDRVMFIFGLIIFVVLFIVYSV